jgi:hypothetical protein
MKAFARQFAAVATLVALLSAGMAPLSPAWAEEDFIPFIPDAALQPPAPQSDELLAIDMSRIIGTQTRLIRYQATEYQRKVAEQRARAFVAAHRRAQAAAKSSATSKTTAKKSPKKKTSEPTKTSEPKVAEKKGKKPQTESKTAKKTPIKIEEEPEKQIAEKPVKKLPRYVAVDTVKDKRAAPGTKKVVMIWDTHAEALVGNNIYDVQNPPRVGDTKVFETYSAEYIGAGL